MEEPATLASQPAPPDAERELWDACQGAGSQKAREALFSRYQPLARRIAWRFMRDNPSTPLEFAELLQLGSLGLLEAIDLYEPGRGVPFRFYCTRRVAGAIIDGISRLSEVNQQISIRRRLERERLRSLKADTDSPATLADKLAALGDVVAELAIGLMLEDSTMVLTDERDPAKDAYETMVWKQAMRQVVDAVETLPPREGGVIRHHYLEGMPFDQIARLMDLSKGRVSQIHKAGIALLRKRLSGMGRFRLQG